MSKSMDERLAKCRLDAAAFDSVQVWLAMQETPGVERDPRDGSP